MELIKNKETFFEGLELIKEGIINGNTDPLESYIAFKPITEALTKFEKAVKPYAITEAHNYGKGERAFGYEITVKNGAKRPQYAEDEVYAKLQEQLSERKALLDAALKTSQPFFDDQGIEVPKVTIKYNAESLLLKKA